MSELIKYAPKDSLILPEYGRNIQEMVDYAITIKDKEERTRCAKTIIDIMGNLFPYLRDIQDFKHKLWDHLALMSNFKLDIDYPYEILKPNTLRTAPDKIFTKRSHIAYLQYGRTIQELIAKAVEMPEGVEKEALIRIIANQMKKNLLIWNKESVTDTKVFKDLKELSHGKIDLDESKMQLASHRDLNKTRKMGNSNGKKK